MHRLSAVIILANILEVGIDTVSVDLALKTRGEDSVQRRTAPLDTELDDWRIGRVFPLIVGGWIPELDDIVLAHCGEQLTAGVIVQVVHNSPEIIQCKIMLEK